MKEQQTNEKEVIVVDRIDKDNYKEYIGKTVKVTGDVNLSNLGLTKLPINFTEVGGYFICTYNELTSLVGAPKEVGGDFWCYYNDLTSLKGSPEKVGNGFHCSSNQLTDLVGSPKEVGGGFYCFNNKLTSLKGAPSGVGGDFDCSHNLLLVGRPEFIGGEFIS